VAALGVAGAAAAVLVAALGGRGRPPVRQAARPVVAAPAAPPAARMATATTPQNPAAAPETIVVEIETEPEGARVVRARDRAPLGTTPLKLTWSRGDGTEPLEVEHDGYRAERVAVPLERGLTAKLHLDKVARTARPGGAAGHPKRGPAKATKAQPEPLKI
jgi:hypothetical protein